MRKLIAPLAISAALLFASQTTFAQGVGINTMQPDPSAALEIVGTDKGLLIPRISLQSLTDNATVPNPATALLVYNTNAGLGQAGFYYNAGTPASPSWSLVGGGGSLTLPFLQSGSHLTSLFHVNNTGGIGVGSAITGESEGSVGVRGQTNTGRGIVGTSTGSGVGVAATNSSTGLALEVNGKIKIAGVGQSPGNGKVLTSDANGNASWENISGDVAFKASGILGGGNQNISSGNAIKVAFANEHYDLGSNYNNSSGSPHSTFIVSEKGIYHFDVAVGCACLNGCSFKTRLNLILNRNGFSSVIGNAGATAGGQTFNSISLDVELEQGDSVHSEIIYDGVANSEPVVMQSGNFSGRLIIKQ